MSHCDLCGVSLGSDPEAYRCCEVMTCVRHLQYNLQQEWSSNKNNVANYQLQVQELQARLAAAEHNYKIEKCARLIATEVLGEVERRLVADEAQVDFEAGVARTEYGLRIDAEMVVEALQKRLEAGEREWEQVEHCAVCDHHLTTDANNVRQCRCCAAEEQLATAHALLREAVEACEDSYETIGCGTAFTYDGAELHRCWFERAKEMVR